MTLPRRPAKQTPPGRARLLASALWELAHPRSAGFSTEGTVVPVSYPISHVRVLSAEEADRRAYLLGQREGVGA